MSQFVRCAIPIVWVALLQGLSFGDDGDAAPQLGLWNETAAQAWWAEHQTPDEWLSGAADLQRALIDCFRDRAAWPEGQTTSPTDPYEPN